MTAHSLFISDLHLVSHRPRSVAQFFELTGGPAREAEALYVLGDLFEYWAGDDDVEDALNESIADTFSRLGSDGTRVYFMHGNRDLLVGREFAQRSGATLLDDPTLLQLYGAPTLLMHGDALCTDDIDHQEFRTYARNPENQMRFLAQPLAVRRAAMENMRERSETSKQEKTAEVMDVNEGAVEQALRGAGYPRLIHGHTHRPGRHLHVVDGHDCERWVLGDWYDTGSYLRCDASGCRSVSL